MSKNNSDIMKKTNANTCDILNDYYAILSDKCIKKMISPKKMEKVDSEDIYIPKFGEYEMISRYNYNVQHLKLIAKYHKLKISGNKPQLVSRIYSFLFLSNFAIKIQKYIRGIIVRKYLNSHGPAFKKRDLCTNTTDFLSMEPLDEISHEQFFSFMDSDGFIYGFDLQSVYNYVYKNNGAIKNPYTRNPLSSEIVERFRTLIRLSRVLKINILTDIEKVEVSDKKTIELRIVTLFQTIDNLGNYSNPKWFMDLNITQLIKMFRELLDIWAYRAPLSLATKCAICPPHGNPFPSASNMNSLYTNTNIDNVRKIILETLEKFVNSGIDRDNQCLGAYYVLASLTLVNVEAATSMPWLFQAVN
jgi:hypothetical protein